MSDVVDILRIPDEVAHGETAEEGTCVPRKLRVPVEGGRHDDCPEDEFFAEAGPLVVLGDPGIGKTALARRFAERTGSVVIDATALKLHEERLEASPPRKTVVDGVDEVLTSDPGGHLAEVLSRFSHDGDGNFVLVFRASAWRAVNSRLFTRKWGSPPWVGRLLPLDDDGIRQVVGNHFRVSPSAPVVSDFLEEAARRGIAGLLGNPQYLKMLLTAHGKWPKTKRELYRTVCETLAKEHSTWLSAYPPPGIPPSDRLVEGAGFVCAQLLLSGASAARIHDGPDGLPTVNELSGMGFSTEDLEHAISTRLFSQRAAGAFEPCHRTVAEYLAAKWVGEGLDKGEVTVTDIEAALRASDSFVPSSLRGLHAWIGVLCSRVTDRFAARDPYGFWCHGDKSELGARQAAMLLDRMEATDIDPDYASLGEAGFEEWRHDSAVLDRVTDIILDPETDDRLVRLVATSVGGEEAGERLAGVLETAVFEQKLPTMNRRVCLECLLKSRGGHDLGLTLRGLLALGDRESLDVAVDAIRRHPAGADGATVAKVLIQAGPHGLFWGMGHYQVLDRLSSDQVSGGLEELRGVLSNPGDNHARRGAQHWVTPFLEKTLAFGLPLDEGEWWPLLRLAKRVSHYETDWEERSTRHFSAHTGARRRVQADAISETAVWDFRSLPGRLTSLSPGLAIGEDDLVFHMDSLLAKRPPDYVSRWERLVLFGEVEQHGKGFRDCVDAHVRQNLELRDSLADAKRHAAPAEERREQARAFVQKREDELRKWHETYREAKAEIVSGNRTDLLLSAAKVYIGYGHADRTWPRSPHERLERFVGKDMVQHVFAGLRQAVTDSRNFVPRREIATAGAKNASCGHRWMLAAFFRMTKGEGWFFDNLPLEIAQSALAVFHSLYWPDRTETDGRVTERLEEIVLTSSREKERHVRDMAEPYMGSDTRDIPGVVLLTTNPRLSGIGGEMAKEWLVRYPDMPDRSFLALLKVLHKTCDKPDVRAFLRERVEPGDWHSDTERGRFMRAVFELDFEAQRDRLAEFMREGKERLRIFFQESPDLGDHEFTVKLNPSQNLFLIEEFAPVWPYMEDPHSTPEGTGVEGPYHSWEASLFLARRIDALKDDLSEEATDALHRLARSDKMNGYHERIANAYALQRRNSLENRVADLDLQEIQAILRDRHPLTHGHLLAVVLDMLRDLQNLVANSSTRRHRTFWDADSKRVISPKDENLCRDHLKDMLDDRMSSGHRDLRLIDEARMPGGRWADLLCVSTKGGISIPVEIKCQWSTDLGKAAHEQLADYVRNHDSGRTGLLVVLWFGTLESDPRKNPEPFAGKPPPRTAKELWQNLRTHCADVPYRLGTFVLDLSGESGTAGQGVRSDGTDTAKPGLGRQ